MRSNQWKRVGCISVFLMMGGFYVPVSADKVYRWVDEKGQLHFSDQPVQVGKEIEAIEVKKLPMFEHSDESQQRLEENRRWFQQRSKERKAEEARRAKQQAKLARANHKNQQGCQRARQKLADAKTRYDIQRRTWLKASAKRKLKERLEVYASEVESSCSD